MGNRTVRIQTKPNDGDKYIKVKLEQDVDMFEILSLQISQKDVYSSFNSTHGILIGRVLSNNGVPVANARVGIFIPLDDDDANNSDVIAVYPYKTVNDLDQDGRKFNLLPRVSRTDNPFVTAGTITPTIPIGSFYTKEEIVTNPILLYVYRKYYYLTTLTNESGDYMLSGVPIGNQTLHISADITDVGEFSMTAASMINMGISPSFFEDGKIKYNTDLDTLPNINLINLSVNIRSFFGDSDNFEIGLTRQDAKLRASLTGSFTIFGFGMTDAIDGGWGSPDGLYHINADGNFNTSIASKRVGTIHETIYYLPNTISDADIVAGNYDPSEYKVLDSSFYTSYTTANGEFAYVLPCNRKKIVRDGDGTSTEVSNDNSEGIFTEFVGFIVFEYSDTAELPMPIPGKLDGHGGNTGRMILKIPQSATFDNTFSITENANTDEWRKQNFKFSYGNFYSVSRFHALAAQPSPFFPPVFNNPGVADIFHNVGVIVADPSGDQPDNSPEFQFPTNTTMGVNVFAAEWMNFCIYFPQINYYWGISGDKVNALLTLNTNSLAYINDNNQLIAAKEKNTNYYGRSDANQSNFVVVPKEDILNILTNAPNLKGFDSITPPFDFRPLIGNYPSTGSLKYFYRGLNGGDAISFLRKNGLI